MAPQDDNLEDNVEPLTYSRLGLVQKIKLSGHFSEGSQFRLVFRWFICTQGDYIFHILDIFMK